MWEVILTALKSSIFVTGLVVIMMLLIESFNIGSEGRVFQGLRKSRFSQLLVSSALGAVPGCMGGFASVSLYTHKLLSFGALVAMMIATTGDEAFLMMALFPGKAAFIFIGLLVLGVVCGFVIDLVPSKRPDKFRLDDTFEIHDEHDLHHHHDHGGHSHESDSEHHHHHISWRKVVMIIGIAAYLVALLCGDLEQEMSAFAPDLDVEAESSAEEWMFWFFGVCGLIVIGVLLFSSEHFIKEHLWEHIVVRHLPAIFLWTMGVLLAVGVAFHFLDPQQWIKDNSALMILLAIAVGCIPESGPHMIFITLYAAGVVPFPVLLANAIVQEGHAALPLLAESKTSFIKAKAIKIVLALALGFGALALGI